MPGRGASSVSFSPDGAWLATGADHDAGVRLWDAATGKLLRTFRASADDDTCQAAFSPDGKMLASTSYRAGGVVFWDPATGKELRRIRIGGRGRLQSLAWAPDSRRLAVWADGGAHLFDATTGMETPTPEGHRCHPGSVALLSDGTAMTAGDDGTVRLWDAATGKHRRVLRVSDGWVRGAAVSPDGRWIVTSTVSGDNAVSLWELKTGKLLYRLPGHGSMGGYRFVAFAADSTQFLSCGDDRFLRAWAVRNGKATADWELRPDGEKPPDPDEPRDLDRFMRFGAATFSRDGKSLVLAGMDGFFVFDVKTGEQVRKISRDQGVVSGAAISPDGKLVLAGSWGRTRRVTNPDGSMGFTTSDTTVSLHDLTTGKLVYEQKHARSSVGPVAFSPDGKSFAVAAPENAISFHDTVTGILQGEKDRLPGRVASLAFSPDGKRVIAGLSDTTALIYPVPTKEKPR
jgi:WD40 repeat protein